VSDDPFEWRPPPEGPGWETHPEFKRCENDNCDEYLVWDVWTSEGGTKCKAWRCPTKSFGHTTEFVN